MIKNVKELHYILVLHIAIINATNYVFNILISSKKYNYTSIISYFYHWANFFFYVTIGSNKLVSNTTNKIIIRTKPINN